MFPDLAEHRFEVTSNPTFEYNCIAWAAEDDENWWWPSPESMGTYWPPGVPREQTLKRFVQAFRTLGYKPCTDGVLEVGMSKVALYVDSDGVPTHAARQMLDGMWASKLGKSYDIVHHAPEDFGAKSVYGTVALYLSRAVE